MSTKSEEILDKEKEAKLNAITNDKITSCIMTLACGGTTQFRLQEGEHNGNGVYFNPDGAQSRFGVDTPGMGCCYVTTSPKTAMKEVFKHSPGLDASDLDGYYMAELEVMRNLQVVNLNDLLPKAHLTLHEVTSAHYLFTRRLATRLASTGVDGLSYLSNVTGEPCTVLWDSAGPGTDKLATKTLTQLSQFSHQGREAETILVDDLNIPVI